MSDHTDQDVASNGTEAIKVSAIDTQISVVASKEHDETHAPQSDISITVVSAVIETSTLTTQMDENDSADDSESDSDSDSDEDADNIPQWGGALARGPPKPSQVGPSSTKSVTQKESRATKKSAPSTKPGHPVSGQTAQPTDAKGKSKSDGIPESKKTV